jgi:hypothetical protein
MIACKLSSLHDGMWLRDDVLVAAWLAARGKKWIAAPVCAVLGVGCGTYSSTKNVPNFGEIWADFCTVTARSF